MNKKHAKEIIAGDLDKIVCRQSCWLRHAHRRVPLAERLHHAILAPAFKCDGKIPNQGRELLDTGIVYRRWIVSKMLTS